MTYRYILSSTEIPKDQTSVTAFELHNKLRYDRHAKYLITMLNDIPINTIDMWNDYDFCYEVIDIDATSFFRVNKQIQTFDMALKAVIKDYTLIKYVRNDLINHELMLTAVNQSWKALEFIKPEQQTPVIARIALMEDTRAYNWIAARIRNTDEFANILEHKIRSGTNTPISIETSSTEQNMSISSYINYVPSDDSAESVQTAQSNEAETVKPVMVQMKRNKSLIKRIGRKMLKIIRRK